MRILFSISYYYPYISGLTLYCQRLAEALVKRKYGVVIITSRYDKKSANVEIREGVRIVRVPYLFKISKGLFMPLWLSKAFQLVNGSDVVFINLPQFEGCITALVARFLRKKVISIYHCEVNLPGGFFNRLIESALHLVNILSLCLSDKIITYTKDYANNSKILSWFTKKLDYIYPPMIFPQHTIQKKIRNDNVMRIGFAGRIASEKGIEYLLAAIPEIEKNLPQKTLKIIIAGPKPVGEEKYSLNLNKLINKYNKYLTYLGSLAPLGQEEVKNRSKAGKIQTMLDFYKVIDILVLPSLNSTESFGMVQVEAMYFGVPVIASNLPGVRVPIQQTGMGELVVPGNSIQLAQKVIKVYTNISSYLKKQNEINKYFSLNETLNFYERVISY